MSKDQLDFGAHVTLQGYAWYVAFGWRQAVAIIERYIAGFRHEMSPHQQKVHEKMMEIANGLSA